MSSAESPEHDLGQDAASLSAATFELKTQTDDIVAAGLEVLASLRGLESRGGEWRISQLPEHARTALREAQRVTTAGAQRLEQQVSALKHAAEVIRETL